MKKSKTRGLLAALTAVLIGTAVPMMFPASAEAFWSRRNLEPFDPDSHPRLPYDPNSVGYGGTGAVSGGPTDCYWSREQIYIGGRFTWRPLLMCMYPE